MKTKNKFFGLLMFTALLFFSSHDMMGQQTKVKVKNGEVKVQKGGDKITVGDKDAGKSDKNKKSDIKVDLKSTDHKGKDQGKGNSNQKKKGNNKGKKD